MWIRIGLGWIGLDCIGLASTGHSLYAGAAAPSTPKHHQPQGHAQHHSMTLVSSKTDQPIADR
eukprot:10802314-Alexandrium_andersonii.AAC.1